MILAILRKTTTRKSGRTMNNKSPTLILEINEVRIEITASTYVPIIGIFTYIFKGCCSNR